MLIIIIMCYSLVAIVDKPLNGVDLVFTTEYGTATPNGDANLIVDDELDPMVCDDAPVGNC